MEINTKYNIGDLLWLMVSNTPKEIRIEEIHIEVRQKQIPMVKYKCRCGVNTGLIAIRENEATASKEDLRRKVFGGK